MKISEKLAENEQLIKDKDTEIYNLKHDIITIQGRLDKADDQVRSLQDKMAESSKKLIQLDAKLRTKDKSSKNSDRDDDRKPEPKSEPKAEAKPEPKPEPKAEAKPEPKPEPKAEVKPELRSRPTLPKLKLNLNPLNQRRSLLPQSLRANLKNPQNPCRV